MKRIISTILVLTLLCFCIPAGVFAEGETVEPNYSKEISILKALGLLQINDATQPATRAGFVGAVAKLCGYAGEYIAATDYFYDVYSGHAYEGAIAYAAGMGIIVGDGSSLFRPDDTITAEEAVIVLLRSLGYEKYVPYQQSYMVTAHQAGILDNIDAPSGNLNLNMAAKLIYNAMNSQVVKVVGANIGGGVSEVKLEKNGTTLLNFYLKIYAVEAIVADNGLSSIEGQSTVSPGYIKLGNDVYDRGEFNAFNLLGHTVEAYYDEDNRLVYIYDITDENDILEISAEFIVSAAGGNITYENESGKQKTVNYKLSAPIIYNGKALKAGEFTADMLEPELGGLKLIRHRGESDYSLIVVTDAFNCVVSNIYENEGVYTFTDVDSALKNINVDTEDVDFTVNISDGKTAKIACESIAPYDVLTVSKSCDGQVINIIVSNTSINGSVSEVKGGTTMEIKVDGTFYPIAHDADTFDMTPGAVGTFYLDIYGNIVCFVPGDGGNKTFAYLIKTNVFDDDEEEIRFKIFDRTGQIKVLEGADKIMVDGSSVKAGQFTALKSNLDNMPRNVIMYETNGDGQVRVIDTVYRDISSEGENTLREIETLALARPYSGYTSGLQFYGNVNEGMFDGQVYIDDKTIIMGIPYGNSGDDEDYHILPKSYFISQRYYSVLPFTNDGSCDLAKVLLVSYTPKYDASLESVEGITVMPSTEARNMQTGVVIDSYIALNDQGEAATHIKMLDLKTNTEAIYTVRWNELESLLEKGSVVRYYVLKDKILDAEKMFDLDTKTVSAEPRAFYGATKTYVVEDGGRALSDNLSSNEYGRTAAWYMAYLDVISVKGNILTAVAHDAGSYSRISDTTGTLIEKYITTNLSDIYKYEPKTQTLKKANIADIVAYENTQSECSKILVFSDIGKPFGMIIVE